MASGGAIVSAEGESHVSRGSARCLAAYGHLALAWTRPPSHRPSKPIHTFNPHPVAGHIPVSLRGTWRNPVSPKESPGAGASLVPSTMLAPPCPAGIMTDGAGVPTGTPLADPPLVEAISEDPVLRNTKLIAEAWDCDGLNQVGVGTGAHGRVSGQLVSVLLD